VQGWASRLWENVIPQADTKKFKYLNNASRLNLILAVHNRHLTQPGDLIGFITGSFCA